MTDGIDEWTNQIHQGDAIETLRAMPESSVHCVVTSPPYYGLRDYGDETITVWGGDAECDHEWVSREVYQDSPIRGEGDPLGEENTEKDERWRTTGRCVECGARREQLGLEEHLDNYIEDLVSVFREVRRVLRPDGCMFLNLGDTYSGGGGVAGKPDDWDDLHDDENYPDDPPAKNTGFPRKCKMLVPHRVAIALIDDGWLVRNDLVANKINPMPESVTDRWASTYENVFFCTPKPRYWSNLDRIRQPHAESSLRRNGRHDHTKRNYPHQNPQTLDPEQFVHPNGKNPGDVLEVTVKPFPEAHFAVMPDGMAEDPIKLGTPPKVCDGCGTPYEQETEEADPLSNPRDREQKAAAIERFQRSDLTREHLEAVRAVGITDADYGQETQWGIGRNLDETERLAAEAKDVLGSYAREFISPERVATGWSQACDCDTDDTGAGVVLDPFAGAGTTCLVAKRLGYRFIGVDLNPKFVGMAQKRVGIDVDEPELLDDWDDGQVSLASIATDGGGD